MNKINKIIIAFFFLIPILGYSKNKQNQPIDKLVKLMAGEYSSIAQSKSDTDYFNIHLVMLPIWKNEPNGYWLYVEQAMGTMLEKPYRQRVYHLTQINDSCFVSDIYMINNEKKIINCWKNSERLSLLVKDSIQIKNGCAVSLILKKNNSSYQGSTHNNDCSSNLRGASYATTKVTIKKGELKSWDQGWNAENKQVWGATKGGYNFKKIRKFK